MKKIGLVAGVAVACIVIQGCKAPNARKGTNDAQPSYAAADAKPAGASAKQEPAKMEDLADKKPAAEAKQAEPAPVVPVVETKPAEEETTAYVVKGGDTLSGICARYGLRQKKVLEINPGMDANKLYAGKRIKLPGKVELKEDDAANLNRKATAAKPAAKQRGAQKQAPAAASYEGATKEYVVVSGDSLGKIAYSNGITIRALKKMNGLTKDTLRIGQKLKVPAEKPAAKAKTASAPAKKPAEAAAKPEVKPAEAQAGDATVAAEPAKTEAPAAAEDQAKPAEGAESAPQAPAAAEAAAEPQAPATQDYVVKENEDVIKIAIDFNLNPSTIADLNGINATDQLKPGQVLKIPVRAK